MAAYALKSELISREPIQRNTTKYFVMRVVRKGGKIGEVGGACVARGKYEGEFCRTSKVPPGEGPGNSPGSFQ